jgi:hypothetical protein
MKLIHLLTLIFMSTSTHALIGIGHMSAYTGKVQGDTDGSSESLLSPNFYLSLHHQFQLTTSIFFLPEIGYVFPKAPDGTEDTSKRSVTFLLYDFGYSFSPNLVLRMGAGTFITKVSGDGGSIELRNGASGTLTFQKPSESVKSYNSTINLGAELILMPGHTLRLENHIWQILSSEERSTTFSFSYNYHFSGSSSL